MKLSHFNYNLPPELLAEYPATERDESRLMVLDRKKQTIEHKLFKDLIDYFDEDDVMILNNTKVFPARLYGNKEKTGARIEVFLLRELNEEQRLWDVLVDPARKIRIGNKLYFGDSDLVAEVIDNTTSRGRTIRFLYDGDHDALMQAIHELGETPLPDEIRLKRAATEEDRERFQTIYAEHVGAVAAPTAGLHFSKIVMKKMELNGVQFSPITLHVGLGTFRQVDVEDLTKHKTDSEHFIIDETTCGFVNGALDNNKHVLAIGTTVMKALESSVSASGHLKPINSWTDKFIFPPYEFKIPTALLTNFHLPESILYMMASAFGSYELVQEAYKQAIKEKYRFYSYGDAMLII